MSLSKKSLSVLALTGLACSPAFAATPEAGVYNTITNGTLASVTVTSTGKYTGTTLVLATAKKGTITGTVADSKIKVGKADVDLSDADVVFAPTELEVPFNGTAFVVNTSAALGDDDYAALFKAKADAITAATGAQEDAAAALQDALDAYNAAKDDVKAVYDQVLTDNADDVLVKDALDTDAIADLATSVSDLAEDLQAANDDLKAKKALVVTKTAELRAAKTTAEKRAATSALTEARNDVIVANDAVSFATSDLNDAKVALATAERIRVAVIGKFFSVADKAIFNSLPKLAAVERAAGVAKKKADDLLAGLQDVREVWKFQNGNHYASVVPADELILVAGSNAGGKGFTYSGPSFSTVAASVVSGDVVLSLNNKVALAGNGLLPSEGANINVAGTAVDAPVITSGVAAPKMSFARLTYVDDTGDTDVTYNLKVTNGKFQLTRVVDTKDVLVSSKLVSNNGIVSGTVSPEGKPLKAFGSLLLAGATDATYAELDPEVTGVIFGNGAAVSFKKP